MGKKGSSRERKRKGGGGGWPRFGGEEGRQGWEEHEWSAGVTRPALIPRGKKRCNSILFFLGAMLLMYRIYLVSCVLGVR